jgi:hypothetical protein
MSLKPNLPEFMTIAGGLNSFIAPLVCNIERFHVRDRPSIPIFSVPLIREFIQDNLAEIAGV